MTAAQKQVVVDVQGATATALRAAAHAYHVASQGSNEAAKARAERLLYSAAFEFAGLALIRVGEDQKEGT